jgi:hypothetical protein
VLELCFSTYDPENIGIIDFHGANRQYERENVGGLHVNIEDTGERYRQHALYNYREKYKNIKTELASAFIRDLISERSGSLFERNDSIVEALQELFRLFFPGKSFAGVEATAEGKVGFPVDLESGGRHDINELSSGEKEILYGYLRLHNTSPANSIVLLDEPELHLNPRLVVGLPKFYQRYLGTAKNNQIWLATHSDAFLRSAVGEPGFSVFHMRSPLDAIKRGVQMKKVSADNDVETALLDLVGDLAAYSPGGKLVVFEGGGDSEFDVKFVSELFPEVLRAANLISGENKARVRLLAQALERAFRAKRLNVEVFSVTDRDSDESELGDIGRHLVWSVYHIENFLLSNTHLAEALNDLHSPKDLYTPEWVNRELCSSAARTVSDLVEHELRRFVNESILRGLNLRIDPRRQDKAVALTEAVSRSLEAISRIGVEVVDAKTLASKEQEIRARYEGDLRNGDWRKSFKGREILKDFANHHGGGIKYVQFRNLVLARMRSSGYQPEEMRTVLGMILGASGSA